MKRLIFLFAALFAMTTAQADVSVAKVSALASGKLLLNGVPSNLASIEQEFKKLHDEHGNVWYYRENAQSEPTEQAMEVIKLIVKYKLPISFSTKPDFSDYVDENGQSHPRKQ